MKGKIIYCNPSHLEMDFLIIRPYQYIQLIQLGSDGFLESLIVLIPNIQSRLKKAGAFKICAPLRMN